MWKILMKGVDLGEPTSFLDHVYFGCTLWECETSKDIVVNWRSMFEEQISAEATEKLPSGSRELEANISSWSYDMEGHIIDTLLWYNAWQFDGSNLTSAKLNLLRKQKRAYKSSWSQRGNPNSFTLTILWNLASLVKNYPGIIVHQNHIDQKQMGLQKEQCAMWKKRHLRCCCNRASTTNGGQILWNANTYLRNVQDLLSDGKTPHERRFGKPFKGPIIPFGSLVEYHPMTAKDQSRIHQFGKKVLPGLFLGYALYAGGIWKGDVLVADLEELETMDASEIYSKRLNAKEVIFPNLRNILFFLDVVIQSYQCKTKTSQETKKNLQMFLEPTRKPKVIYTDNSLEFGKVCEDLSWNHCTSTPHKSETHGIAERAVRKVKEGTSASIVAIRSGWKLVGRFYGMLYLSAKRSRSLIW